MESESISQSGSWHPSADPGLQGWPEPPGQHRGSSPQPEVIFGISKTHSVGPTPPTMLFFFAATTLVSTSLNLTPRANWSGLASSQSSWKAWIHDILFLWQFEEEETFCCKDRLLFQPEFLQNDNNLAVWAIAYWSSLVWLTWGVMMVVMGMAWWVEVTRVMKIGNNVKLGWIFEFLMIEEQKMRWFRWIAVVKLLIQRKEVELWIWVKSRKP